VVVLRFSLGPIPVAVHFSFGLLLYIAYSMTGDLAEALIAGLGIFAGVLLHETGHALTARRFGATDVRITLFALGGVTTYPPPAGLTAGRRFLIAGAGSALAITFSLPVYLALRADVVSNRSALLVAWGFVVAALLWGLLNWIPIRPLDGGQMLTSALQILWPRRGEILAKILSSILTVVAIVLLVRAGERFLALYVGFIGFVGLRSGPTESETVERKRPRSEQPPPVFPL